MVRGNSGAKNKNEFSFGVLMAIPHFFYDYFPMGTKIPF
jgi:hypothetical protein